MNFTELEAQLTSLADSYSLSLGDLSQCIAMLVNKQKVLEQHTAPISQNPKDLRWRTRLPNGKQIVKTKRQDLEDVLIDYYIKESKNMAPTSAVSVPIMPTTTISAPLPQSVAVPQIVFSDTYDPQLPEPTLLSIYVDWYKAKKPTIAPNSIQKYIDNWHRYIAPSDIAKMPLQKLNRNVLKSWASDLITEHSMKKKYFEGIKIVLNSLLDYAAEEEMIEFNKFRGIRLNNNLFAPPTLKEEHEEVFTESEQKLIMQEALKDSAKTKCATPLGICLLFFTGMRVGELCGLKVKDYRGNYLYVERMVVEEKAEEDGDNIEEMRLVFDGYKIVEHPKTSAGRRRIYLTQEARELMDQIIALNKAKGFSMESEDMLFQRKKGLCNQRVFNSRLDKYCSERYANLPFMKSCHDIRRTYISHLFDLGINPDKIRRMAGHENIEQTMRYSRGRAEQKELEQKLEEELNK